MTSEKSEKRPYIFTFKKCKTNIRESHEYLATDISLFNKLTPIFVHFSTLVLTAHRGHILFCDFFIKTPKYSIYCTYSLVPCVLECLLEEE